MPPKAAITAPSAAQSTTAPSLWQKWAAPAAYAATAGALLTAVGGAAYLKREDIGVGATWINDHLKYVGTLWSRYDLEARLDRMLEIESRMGVLFQT